MSYLQKFTEEETELLMCAPQLVGVAVTSIGSSGVLGSVKEAMASIRALMDGVKSYPDNALVASISPSMQDADAAKKMAKDQKDMVVRRIQANEVKGSEQLADLMIDDLCKINDILAEKESPEVAAEYKMWLREIAVKVAEAAKEGGFLGFGGTLVSDGEQALLDRISANLNLMEA